MKECKHTYRHTCTHSLTHSHKQNFYIWAMLLLSFQLQCVTAVVRNKGVSVFYWSKAKLCSSVWPSGHTIRMLLFVPSRGEELVTHLSLLLFRLSPVWCHSNFLALSEEVHREEQKEKSTVSATRVISKTLFFVFLLLTAHALLAASSFNPHPSQCSRWTLPHHPLRCKTRPYHDEWRVQMGVFWRWRGLRQVL